MSVSTQLVLPSCLEIGEGDNLQYSLHSLLFVELAAGPLQLEMIETLDNTMFLQ